MTTMAIQDVFRDSSLRHEETFVLSPRELCYKQRFFPGINNVQEGAALHPMDFGKGNFASFPLIVNRTCLFRCYQWAREESR